MYGFHPGGAIPEDTEAVPVRNHLQAVEIRDEAGTTGRTGRKGACQSRVSQPSSNRCDRAKMIENARHAPSSLQGLSGRGMNELEMRRRSLYMAGGAMGTRWTRVRKTAGLGAAPGQPARRERGVCGARDATWRRSFFSKRESVCLCLHSPINTVTWAARRVIVLALEFCFKDRRELSVQTERLLYCLLRERKRWSTEYRTAKLAQDTKTAWMYHLRAIPRSVTLAC